MTGPQDHDDARPAGTDPAHQDGERPAEAAAREAAEVARSIDDALEPDVEERLDEAKAWEPAAWEPHDPANVSEAPAEEHSILDEDPTVSIPSVDEVIGAAEEREPTATDGGRDGAAPGVSAAQGGTEPDAPEASAAPESPAAQVDHEDPEDTAIRDRGAWAAAAEPGAEAAAAPETPQEPAGPATQAMEVAPPAPLPTQAELAAAFPSTPFGRVSPGGEQPTSGAPAAVPAGPAGYGETDLDATMLHAPLLPPTPQPQPPIPGYGQAPAGAPARRPRGADRRPPKKKTPVWAILVGALIGAALIVGIVLLAWQPWDKSPSPSPSASPTTGQATQSGAPGEVVDGSPAAAVRDLGEALVKGDATTALGLLDESLTAPARDVDNALLSNEAYAAAKNRPTAITIDPASTAAVAEDITSARVTAVVKQNGKDVRTTFQVRRATTTGPWFVDPSTLPTVRVSNASGTTIKVNGADVKVPGNPGDYSTTRFRVLPGSYSVEGKADTFTSFAKAETLNASIATLGTEGSANAGAVAMKPKRTDAFKTAATKAVDSWLDKCAAATTMSPSGCPFSGPSTFEGAKVTDVKWSIDKRPTLSFHDYGIGAETVSGSGGTASVTGKAKVDGQEQKVSGKVSSFSVRGTLTVKGKDVTFTPAS